MDSPIMFKSAVGGFDKKAVISYIFELNEKSQTAQKRLKEQLDEVMQAREALDQQLAESTRTLQKAQAESESLRDELAGEKARTGELTEMVEGLNAEIERQREIIAQKEEELKASSRQGNEFHGKYQQMEARREEVERASAQIGSLLLEAKADAERIRATATDEAGQTVAEARRQADGVVSAANAQAQDIEEAARRQADSILRDAENALKDSRTAFADFRRDMDEMQRNILDAVGVMQDRVRSVGDAMDAAEQRMQPQIARATGNPPEKSEAAEESFFRAAPEED